MKDNVIVKCLMSAAVIAVFLGVTACSSDEGVTPTAVSPEDAEWEPGEGHAPLLDDIVLADLPDMASLPDDARCAPAPYDDRACHVVLPGDPGYDEGYSPYRPK